MSRAQKWKDSLVIHEGGGWNKLAQIHLPAPDLGTAHGQHESVQRRSAGPQQSHSQSSPCPNWVKSPPCRRCDLDKGVTLSDVVKRKKNVQQIFLHFYLEDFFKLFSAFIMELHYQSSPPQDFLTTVINYVYHKLSIPSDQIKKIVIGMLITSIIL